MKNLTLTISLLFSIAFIASADKIERLSPKEATSMTQTERQARVSTLKERVEEIKAMDVTTLERPHKKEVKKELRYIKRELKTHSSGNGIYISTAGVIIIVLLLLLLL